MFLSNATIVYTLACVYYYVATRTVSTPFGDSLTEEQRRIKQESARVRGRIFVHGIVAGSLAVAAWNPFVSP